MVVAKNSSLTDFIHRLPHLYLPAKGYFYASERVLPKRRACGLVATLSGTQAVLCLGSTTAKQTISCRWQFGGHFEVQTLLMLLLKSDKPISIPFENTVDKIKQTHTSTCWVIYVFYQSSVASASFFFVYLRSFTIRGVFCRLNRRIFNFKLRPWEKLNVKSRPTWCWASAFSTFNFFISTLFSVSVLNLGQIQHF